MGRNLSVIWRRTGFNTKEQHPYGHRPTVKSKGETAVFRSACVLLKQRVATVKSEMDKFYRSTPHVTIGPYWVCPAELLFGRRIRTNLHHLQEFSTEDEVRET